MDIRIESAKYNYNKSGKVNSCTVEYLYKDELCLYTIIGDKYYSRAILEDMTKERIIEKFKSDNEDILKEIIM